MHEPSRYASKSASLLALVAVIAVSACNAPTPPPYPYWGPYGSREGVIQEARLRSSRLEQYIKDWLDGKVPAQIPNHLLPEGRDPGITNFVLQRPSEVNPNAQWGVREAHPINLDAAKGFFPDPNATYFLLPHFVAPFGSRVIIEGEFPRARYFSIQPTPSFHPESYRLDGYGIGEVAFVDADINPLSGHTNPFRAGANRTATQRSYRVTCDVAIGNPTVLDPKAWSSPTYRDPGNNHRHCSGLMFRGPWGDPNGNFGTGPDKRGFWEPGQIWVRIYAPDKSVGAYGGVPRPRVLYQLPDGRQYYIHADISSFAARVNGTRTLVSEIPQEPTTNEGSGIGWYKQFGIFRQVFGGIAMGANYPSSDPAAQRKYVNDLDRGVTGRGDSALRPNNLEPHATGSVHINYLTRGMCLGAGKVFTVQGTLPTTPKTRNGESTMTSAQARYWSITGYSTKFDLLNPNFVYGVEMTSVMDDEITTNAQGRYLIVYSRPEDRPANATAANGVTWVNWGREACQAFTLRWMSIGPEWSFTKTPHEGNLGWEADWASPRWDPNRVGRNHRWGFLGDYQPVVSYLTKAQFEGQGARPDPFWLPAY